MESFLIRSLLLLFIFCLPCCANAETQRVLFFDNSILGIEIGTHQKEELEKLLGVGKPDTEMGDMLCYLNKGLKQRVIFSLREDGLIGSVRLIIAQENIGWDCGEALLEQSPKTKKGIELGVSKQFVIEKYGKPISEKILENGDEILEYTATDKDDQRIIVNYDSWLTFREDHLIELIISNGP
ncbi:MAG: hypothetical protein G3M70_13950 [Candidatus Nitronauta litoralis]|uniref:Uncharacterized protein n=1 Tax=Candidatus Nitronauta litoralis TaxID=2705533 RepID=A0A7T0BYN3_9BACT|nr:MAG: hypothetical protein G3M70_13950 [Candidatus Nitronauta litoralis]